MKKTCNEIRLMVMYLIDNEVKDQEKDQVIFHIDECNDCQSYYEAEQEIKVKICKKLKDSYICQCDVNKLTSNIKSKINEIYNK